MKTSIIIWVLGLVSLVPYGIYYLLFFAQPDEYALWITLVLFWIFGFWGVAGPLLSIIKVRHIMRMLENAQDSEEFKNILQSQQSEEAAIDFLAHEWRIPRFLAKKVYKHFLRHVTNANKSPP